jgi:phage gpG-like protein
VAGAAQPLSISIDDAELLRELKRLLAAVQDPSPALREIGEVLTRSTKERFRSERDPDGQPWEQNADSTLLNYLRKRQGLSKRKTATGGRTLTQRGARALGAKQILTDRGDLADSIAYQLEDGGKAVAVGTSRIYAAMQQFGGTTAEHPQLWGDIPARPFLGISDDDEADILAILRAHLGDGA